MPSGTNSGNVIKADIIIPATGLRIVPIGGAVAEVDGKKIEPGKLFLWRGCMLESVPNFGMMLGILSVHMDAWGGHRSPTAYQSDEGDEETWQRVSHAMDRPQR